MPGFLTFLNILIIVFSHRRNDEILTVKKAPRHDSRQKRCSCTWANVGWRVRRHYNGRKWPCLSLVVYSALLFFWELLEFQFNNLEVGPQTGTVQFCWRLPGSRKFVYIQLVCGLTAAHVEVLGRILQWWRINKLKEKGIVHTTSNHISR